MSHLGWNHPSSYVDEGATVGKRTKIWHFCHIMPKARIGKNCTFGQNCFVAGKVLVGDGVKVQNNVSLYEGVILEDDVFVGPSAVFTNVINPRSFIERKDEYLTTHVKKGVTIGANATILCGVTIGEYAVVGAGAVVTKDIAPYHVVIGSAACVIGQTDESLSKIQKSRVVG